ncbi:MAG: 50S ribosomal protein L24 [Minisyncoccia bacterium]
MNTLHIKKGDTVVVLAGNDKGKTGKVLRALPALDMVVVEGVGMKKKHQKPRQEGQQGQIIDKQHPIAASKVMNVDVKKEKEKKRKKK